MYLKNAHCRKKIQGAGLDTHLGVEMGRFRDQGVETRDTTIPFFQIRSDTAHSEDRPIPIQSDNMQHLLVKKFVSK